MPTPLAPSAVVYASDVDGDGRTDFTVYDGAVSTYLSRPDGGFQRQVIARPPASQFSEFLGVAVADLNGDGLLDAIAVDSWQGLVTVDWGAPDGGTAQQAQFSVFFGSDIGLGDFNGDGLVDAVVASGPLLLGAPDGGLVARSARAASTSRSLRAADLDGDGRTDLVAGDQSYAAVVAWYGQPDGGFSKQLLWDGGAGLVNVDVRDLDGDGRPDIAFATGAGEVGSLLAAPDGGFWLSFAADAGLSATRMEILDLDGDGARDLVALGAHANLWFQGYGDGGFAAPALLPATWWYAMDRGDFNGDGQDDLVIVDPSDAGVGIVFGPCR